MSSDEFKWACTHLAEALAAMKRLSPAEQNELATILHTALEEDE